jgi:hypothetical protein
MEISSLKTLKIVLNVKTLYIEISSLKTLKIVLICNIPYIIF